MSGAAEILMPQLSDSMDEGLVLRWLIGDGGEVSAGDELVEIETDKATMVHEAEVGGVLQIVVAEGETAAVGEVIARVGAPALGGGEDPDGGPAEAEQTAPAASSAGAASAVEATPTAAAVATATPVARRVAKAHGVSLADLIGSGPRGRIIKTDVLRAAGLSTTEPAPGRPPVVAPITTPATPAPAGNGATRRELSRLQQVIARRMAEASATIPHFQVETEAEMGLAVSMRARLGKAIAEGEPLPSFNDLVVKACAVALRAHPQANGSYAGESFVLHERVNVGIAVASQGALVVPTVFDADSKLLGQIARETREAAARVRSGEITPAELEGGTFTVSNLGMYGMTAITPVINPPQAAILGVGSIRETLARDNGEVIDRPLLTLTLSCDHRILYGADAALFLAEVKALLEEPLRLTL